MQVLREGKEFAGEYLLLKELIIARISFSEDVVKKMRGGSPGREVSGIKSRRKRQGKA